MASTVRWLMMASLNRDSLMGPSPSASGCHSFGMRWDIVSKAIDVVVVNEGIEMLYRSCPHLLHQETRPLCLSRCHCWSY